METARVLVVAGPRLERDLLCRAIAGHDGLSIGSVAGTTEGALKLLAATDPGVVVLDVSSPDIDPFDVIDFVNKSSRPVPRVLVIGPVEDSRSLMRLVKAGVSGFVPTTSSVDDLLDSIKRVGRGEYTFDTESILALAIEAEDGSLTPSIEKLTNRERDVLGMIAKGLSSKEIAAAFSLSPRTIDCHRSNMMQKLDLHKVTDLVLFAVREGFVSPFDDSTGDDRGNTVLEPCRGWTVGWKQSSRNRDPERTANNRNRSLAV